MQPDDNTPNEDQQPVPQDGGVPPTPPAPTDEPPVVPDPSPSESPSPEVEAPAGDDVAQPSPEVGGGDTEGEAAEGTPPTGEGLS